VNRAEWTTLAGQTAFGALVGRAEAMVVQARKRFVEAGGDAVLALR
jgi:hypothetical protein